MKFIAVFLFSIFVNVTQALAQGDLQEKVTVWSETAASNHIELYIAKLSSQGELQDITNIERKGNNITPSLHVSDNQAWVLWVDRANSDKYYLKYANYDLDGFKLIRRGTIVNPNQRMYSPSIAKSPEGVIWAAWSVANGDENEEVEIAYFDSTSNQWSNQMRMTDNSTANSAPRLTNVNGEFMLTWEQYTSDDAYIMEKSLAGGLNNIISAPAVKSQGQVQDAFSAQLYSLSSSDVGSEQVADDNQQVINQRPGFLMGETSNVQ